MATDLPSTPRGQLPGVYAIVKLRLRCICFGTTSRMARNDVILDGIDILGSTTTVMDQYRRLARQHIVRVGHWATTMAAYWRHCCRYSTA